MERRDFIRLSTAASAASAWPLDILKFSNTPTKKITIVAVGSNFERESLNPYRFKGGAITDSWQSIACLKSESGIKKVGIGTQGVLWSDASVAEAHSEAGGNALMYAVTEWALQQLKGRSFYNPVDLLDEMFPEVYAYAQTITQNSDLRKTFALNALVAVDNAAWLLYAAENGITTFDDMIPKAYRPGLGYRQAGVASIPSFPVGTPASKLAEAAAEGYFIMKLKTGAPGSQREMLEKDKAFLTAVHQTIGHIETPHTADGKIPYYFDANGRYHKKETLLRFVDHAKKIGAFDQLAVIEEPFPESNQEYVGDIGIRVAADESAHTVEDAAHRIELGYTAFAVKAIAKTLSMTMKITQLAFEKDIPCFCADLTVNPILIEWNKNVAARLSSFPDISVGLQEANGHQYYKHWDKLMTYHPMPNASWVKPVDGVFPTKSEFFEKSGGIFSPIPHYEAMFADM
ncbi:mandelate racemase/muconate lactonizing enzyme family protein [Membranihabitans marinus]|uniref:mandelate racemase/muconate lactonizing enzyme family protein n=1 Tax=Membranihabitans marinus TaxID=1227546 RepID=UPI001F45F796|nr:mandelate racemase/muconate lactonizing enzyme family protein [Membranihabitans marinus]